jgi:hypothetical protein
MRLLALPSAAAAAFAALALAAGCSSSAPSGSSTASGDDAGADSGASLQTVHFEMKADVPAGAEMFKCQFVSLPDVAGWMVAGKHSYTPGSHHLLLYTTDLTAIPAGGGQVQDCYEGTNNSLMSHVRGVLYGGQTPTGGEQLPPGVGLRTTAGQVLLFQVHYLNAAAADLHAQVDVDLTLDTGSDITTNAGILFFYDPFIDVPPGSTAKAAMRCTIPEDITLIGAQSHYHARGTGYGAYLDPSANQLATAPFYTSTSWSSPSSLTTSMPIKAGSHLRFECDYDNTNGTQEYFQGPSAANNEMCMFVGTYYPDMGQLADYCLTGPDMFGTGSATCAESMTCIASCGSSSLGPGASPCLQKCVVQSCPKASTSLIPLLECVKNSCSMQCGGTMSSACTSCVASSCGSQWTACQQQSCN